MNSIPFRGPVVLVVALAMSVPLAAQQGVWDDPASGRRQQLYEGGGGVLLDQLPNGSCLIVSDAAISQVAADNFVVSAATDQSLTQLVFTGGYLFANIPPASDLFEVNLYLDDAGLPGATAVCNQSGVVPTSRTATGRDVGGFDVFELVLDLDGSCVVSPGSTYWIEIYDSELSGDSFSWECGDIDPVNGVSGSAFATTVPGSNWMAQSNEFAITIVSADAGGEPIGGSVTGLSVNGVVCWNQTTGQQILAPTSDTSWDCDALGLVASPGDTVITGARGTVN